MKKIKKIEQQHMTVIDKWVEETKIKPKNFVLKIPKLSIAKRIGNNIYNSFSKKTKNNKNIIEPVVDYYNMPINYHN
jgi:hypothetical protein